MTRRKFVLHGAAVNWPIRNFIVAYEANNKQASENHLYSSAFLFDKEFVQQAELQKLPGYS